LEKINIAIIGCGRIGSRHAQHISRLAKLSVVCDIVTERADKLADQYDAIACYSIEELLKYSESIDVLAVCTPNGLHAQHTLAGLDANMHVLCEKPMAINSRDCGRMIKKSLEVNKRLFIVKQNRFNPPVAAVKKALDNGAFGKVHSFQLSCFWNRNEAYYENSWKGTKDLDGGTLFTQFSHFIDLLYWMFGDLVKANGLTSNSAHKGIIEFEDNGVVTLEFENDVLGTLNYSVNSFGKNMEGSLTIFGEKGTVKIGGQYLNELEYQNVENYDFGKLPQGNPPNSYGNYQGSMSNHDKVYENVLEVLNEGGTIATNGFEGMKTVEIIENIYGSVRTI